MTLSEILRDADPLRYEGMPHGGRRAALRQAIVSVSGVPERATVARRRFVFAAVGAGAAAAIVAIAQPWGGSTVEAAMQFEVRLAEAEGGPGLREAAAGGRAIYLREDVVLTNSDVESARAIPGEDAGWFSVAVRLTPAGAAKMRAATEGHIGRPLAIVVDGKVLAAPIVRAAIDQIGLISGDYTKEEAEKLAAGIVRR